MATSERRARHRASLRREILDAASQLFVEEGYQRVTMRRIAGRIEYSPTTIYLYFKNKHELLGAICDETFSQLASKLDRLKAAPGTPGGASSTTQLLRNSLRAYVEFGTSHPNHYLVAFLQAQENTNDIAWNDAIGAGPFGFLRDAVQACVTSGDLRTESVETTTQSLWAAVHGLTSLFITMRGFPFVSRATLIDHTIDTLIAGLKPPAAPKAAATRQAARLTFMD